MTDLLTRPAWTDRDLHVPPPPLLVGLLVGSALAVAGVLAGMGLAVVGWLGESSAAFTSALQVGALGWLIGHGSGLSAGGLDVTAVPLGLTLLVAHLAYRGGRWTATRSGTADLTRVGVAAAGLASGYVAVVGVVATVAPDATASVSVPRVVLISFALTGVAGWVGAAAAVGVVARASERVPVELRAAVCGGAAGTATFVASSAAVFTVMLVLHRDRMDAIVDSLGVGVIGSGLLVLLCLAVYPNVLALTGSVLLGPGFSFGSGTTVTATGVTMGTLPAFPLLAAIPGSGPAPAGAGALAAIPVVAGMVAGWLGVRASPVFGFDRAALRGACSGVLAGLATGAFVALAEGSVGPGRMSDVGPEVLACLLVAVASMGVGGAFGGLGRHLVHHRRP